MKRLPIILFVLSCSYSFAQVGEVSVGALEDSTWKKLSSATVKIYRNDSLIQEGVTNANGDCKLKNMAPGMYDVSCEEKLHRKGEVKGLVITEGKISFVEFHLKKN